MITPILAALSGNDVLWAVIQIVIAAVIYWLIEWGIAKIGIPEPFNKVLKVILVIFVVLFCINALLTIAGRPLIRW